MRKLILSLAVISAIFLSACDVEETGEYKQNAAQTAAVDQGVNSVGFPAIVNFSEKRELKHIYESRDQEIATWTYTQDMNGHYHLLCPSLGYPLPFSVQYSNPLKPEYTNYGIPQAEPNGLYMPSDAEGTWVVCIPPHKKGSTVENTPAVYVEPRVTTFPYERTDAIQ